MRENKGKQISVFLCIPRLQDRSARSDLIGAGEGAEILAQARLNRADCLLRTGDVENARAEIREVLDHHSGHPFAEYLLTLCPED